MGRSHRNRRGDFNLPEDIKPGTLGTDAEMHLLRAVAFKALRHNDEAITDYLEFFRIYKSIENGKLQSPDMLVYCFVLQSDTILPMRLLNSWSAA
mgnify:CR=1 FL=1